MKKTLVRLSNRQKSLSGGFTLIELLVVVALVSVLAAVVLSAMSNARLKAEYAKAETDLRVIADAVVFARGSTGLPLGIITGDYCSSCACRESNGGMDAACVTAMEATLNSIEVAGNGVTGDISELRDPWGNPYLVEENHMEVTHAGNTSADDCWDDFVRSAGPDGMHDGGSSSYNNDDIVFYIPVPSDCI